MSGRFFRTRIVFLALVFGVLIVNALVLHLNLSWLARNEALVERTHDLLRASERLISTLKDAETGQRGYMISTKKSYLSPYESAEKELPELLADFTLMAHENPEHRAAVDRLTANVQEKRKELGITVEFMQKGDFASAKDRLSTDHGKRLMDEIRVLVDAIQLDEKKTLARQKKQARASFSAARTATMVGLCAGLSTVAIAYYVLQKDRTEELSLANEALLREVDERRTAENKANALALELGRSNRELQEFASVASHDLQEPLRKIQAFGDRLQTKLGPQLSESAGEDLRRIQAAAARMANLISDLLNYSRVSTKASPYSRVDLGKTAREALVDLERRLQETNGRVEIGRLPSIYADPTQMRQLFQNLIGNSLKFHRPGVAPVVEVSADVIDRHGDPVDGRFCRIAVSDNGIGFEDAYRERIFGFFQRLHGRNEYDGSGMGLAICRRIAERHGGAISARGRPNEGATFEVTLPIRWEHESENDVQIDSTSHNSHG